jgi:hypothetical protein
MIGLRVRYTLATKLVNELVEAAANDMVLSKTIARYGRVDLLCIGLCRRLVGRGPPKRTATATAPAR